MSVSSSRINFSLLHENFQEKIDFQKKTFRKNRGTIKVQSVKRNNVPQQDVSQW